MTSGARRALVTGGSSGIGRAVAETLARDGFDVGVLHVGDSGEGSAVVGRIESLGRRGWSRVCDVRDSASVNAAFGAFASRFGGLEALVNNAGIFRDAMVWKMSDEQWREVIDVDLTGAFHCARAASGLMRAANPGSWGSIVNVSSINGLRGKAGQTNYAAAKAGLIGLTKSLARELARSGVTVNAVAPGLIETPATAGLPAEVRERAAGEILLGRLGQVQDVAELVAFLCGERARFITGQVIKVDGGQYI
ncbi:MAG: SDR family oxidoreductase [Phycisphaerae bacterium]|nr:SDR family oxidoreductase [Phycisphaerae bacterium]